MQADVQGQIGAEVSGDAGPQRVHVRVTGVVQGVGFRPFTHRLARDLGLSGHVGNDVAGVFCEVEGTPAAVEAFTARIAADAPPLAKVETVTVTPRPATGERGFTIVPSRPEAGAGTPVSADVGPCAACLAEMADPADRRHRYPLLNCTDCGPRFTITRAVPYDRSATTMDGFTMCGDCRSEYDDPEDRRFHAQPTACPACGPQTWFERPAGTRLATGTPAAASPPPPPAAAEAEAQEEPVSRSAPPPDAVALGAATVAHGGILAVKGVGGYHLACRADDDAAVRRLRMRKHRPHKPFAVMVADVATARRVAHVDAAEAALLEGPERPIVLLRRRDHVSPAPPTTLPTAPPTALPTVPPTALAADGAGRARSASPAGGRLSPAVAPGNGFLGVMLPASPLHALLVPPGEVWVMTSGNVAGQPICIDDDEARDRLGGIADAILGHDRPIHVPCDDSVVRVVALPEPRADDPDHDLDHAADPGDLGPAAPYAEGATATPSTTRGLRTDAPVVRPSLMPIRRSRGYAPYPVAVRLPAGPPLLAVGGDLKATFCLRRDGHAFMGAHVGDMADLTTVRAFERAVAHALALFRTEPEALACDRHPGYASHRWALDNADGRPVVQVQHHHAHLAALMAEHRIDGPIIGFAFDGTGFGDDGTIWGGEVLLADLHGFQRVGHLRESLLAGGDAAVRRPRRQALARLREAAIGWDADLPPVAATGEVELRTLATQLGRQVGTVPTSSMGRLFDAVASLCGIRHEVTYEGQAAIEMEALVDPDGLDTRAGQATGYRITLDDDGVWDVDGLVRTVAADVRAQTPAGQVAARFHAAVAEAIVESAERARAAHGLDVVGLSGGVFANVVLTTAAVGGLRARGFTPLVHRLVPCNDGGLALGQAAVAAAALARPRH